MMTVALASAVGTTCHCEGLHGAGMCSFLPVLADIEECGLPDHGPTHRTSRGLETVGCSPVLVGDDLTQRLPATRSVPMETLTNRGAARASSSMCSSSGWRQMPPST
jgi:hypothetical protein